MRRVCMLVCVKKPNVLTSFCLQISWLLFFEFKMWPAKKKVRFLWFRLQHFLNILSALLAQFFLAFGLLRPLL